MPFLPFFTKSARFDMEVAPLKLFQLLKPMYVLETRDQKLSNMASEFRLNMEHNPQNIRTLKSWEL